MSKIKGKLYLKGEIQQLKENFYKREFVLYTETVFPSGTREEFIPFQLLGNNCDRIEPFQPGQEIVVSYNLGGYRNEKDGITRFFPQLVAWKIEPVVLPQFPGAPQYQAPPAQQPHQTAAPQYGAPQQPQYHQQPAQFPQPYQQPQAAPQPPQNPNFVSEQDDVDMPF